MKHLKKFNNLFEEEGMDNMGSDIEGMGMEDDMMQKNSGTEAKSWIKSTTEIADYDVIWDSPEGEEVSASFSDIGSPIKEDGDNGYSTFETVPGTSSDGNEYIGQVTYEEKKEGVFEIESILISKK